MADELLHRRSSNFQDEYVDKFTPVAMSWNGSERMHVTFGRDSLEVLKEQIVPDPEDNRRAILANPHVAGYRNDVVALMMPLDVAEKLGHELLRMVGQAKKRAESGGAQ
ncbi:MULTISPECIES: hypothetical protein [Pseudomonas syringae group]|uniref:Uncharacterized protein n=2 Tax=Pseudomonas syringae group TaxID=136849 RepID=A0ABY1UA15_PSESX|nr:MULTISPECIES: hypothetical protein [Pseudomonas syringae group]KWT12037.1 hypothetical protein AL046_14160 [Pseudomonas syringae pv. avii]MCF5225874.1 hypothetical protein [Pseudomonas syringae]MCF5241951.1 hypothetical protein [Pseudomonas syringae]MDF5774072.1 hypothetical protein [Pseudomonas syringae pv. syringae]SOQ10353.1 hypothetical protein CFBP1573P_03040 [Pseudomonas syringae pv. persicae]